MTLRKPVVLIDGKPAQLPPSDTLLGAGKEVVTSARTYYVRTDGDDNNDGLSNTSGGAWLTVQHALDFVSQNLIAQAEITIQLADGTYSGNVFAVSPEGTAGITVVGNVSTPTNTKLTSSSGSTVVGARGANVGFNSLEIEATGTFSGAVFAANPGSIISLNACVLSATLYLVQASRNATVTVAGAMSLKAAPIGLAANTGGVIVAIGSATFQFISTPNYADAFIKSDTNGVVNLTGASTSGSMTGVKYKLTTGGKFTPTGLTVTGSSAGTGVLVSDNDELSGYRGALNAQTGTSYTLVAADTGKVVELTNAAAITLTMPNNLPVGWCCTVVQGGAGAATFTAASGATRRNRQSHTKTAGQWAMTTLYVRTNSGGSSAEYVLGGDTAP